MTYIGDQIGALKKLAIQSANAGKAKEAAAYWMKAADLMKIFAGDSVTEESRNRRLHKVVEFSENAKRLDKETGDEPLRTSPTRPANMTAEGNHRSIVRGLRFQAKVSWDQIGGLDRVRDELDSFFGIFMATKPEGVQIDSFRNIMFYGPPGTGKTMIAAAISNQLDAAFFNVKASDLLSKYFGESSKLVSALYQEARSEADTGLSILFIDEFDALCRSRDQNTSGAEQRVLSTLLSELDGLAEKNEDKGVLTIVATNRPDQLDHAIRSRFQKQFFIPLPDKGARIEILKSMLRQKNIELKCSAKDIANKMNGFSGRDINGVVRAAVANMVTRSNPNLKDVTRKGKEEAGKYQIKVAPLISKDFHPAIQSIRVNSEEVARSNKFFKAYGGA